MSAPVTVDLAVNGGPWPGFTLSGVTGTGAENVNGDYRLSGDVGFEENKIYDRIGGGSRVHQQDEEEWYIRDVAGPTDLFRMDGKWPWSTPYDWDALSSLAGTLVFTYWTAPPLSLEIEGAEATVSAQLGWSDGSGSNLLFTSVLPGRLGNEIRMRAVNPGTNNAALSVSVDERDITVNLATNGSAAATSTANQIKTALQASEAASALISVSGSGSGVLPAIGFMSLLGGLGGLPPRPETIDL